MELGGGYGGRVWEGAKEYIKGRDDQYIVYKHAHF